MRPRPALARPALVRTALVAAGRLTFTATPCGRDQRHVGDRHQRWQLSNRDYFETGTS